MTLADKLREVKQAADDPEFADIQIVRTDGGENRLAVAIANLLRTAAALPDPEEVELLNEPALVEMYRKSVRRRVELAADVDRQTTELLTLKQVWTKVEQRLTRQRDELADFACHDDGCQAATVQHAECTCGLAELLKRVEEGK